ncbi:hypothetical protein GCM10027341_26230 [Spirosoma knui]
MYKSDYNAPFTVHEDGTNSPFEHQLVISKLTVELGVLYYHKGLIPLIPLPETPLGDGPGYPVPDVLLFDKGAEQTRVIIEVSGNRSFNSDVRKVIRLIEDDDYGILEGFIYNYKTREWLRYRKGDGGVATTSSFSEVMGVELGAFL